MRSGCVCALLVAFGLLAGTAAGAQNTNPPVTPQHPIDTRPEGSGHTCTYSVTKSGAGTTGSSTCPAPEAGGASAAQRFPYPGEPDQQQPQAGSPVPEAGKAGAPKQPSAAKRFPYPGDPQGDTANPAANSPLQDAGSSGSSTDSSSSSSSSGSNALPPDTGDESGPGDLPAPKRARKKLPPVPRQTPDEREEEDVRVAGFYQNDGNFRAAYMRAKDAVGITEADPEAHFALAEAARKLGKLDEAEQHYKRCLALDPLPKLRKASEKALKEMAGS